LPRTRGTTLVGLLLPLLVAACFVGVWLLVKPAPPREIVFTAGSPGGAYHAFAERYAKVLARSGVRVVVEPSRGSIENLARLTGKAGPRRDVGFVQSGIASPEDRESLVALGTVFHEPLWVFHRPELRPDGLRSLRGLRVNIGPEGSGSRALALRVLEVTGIDATSATFSDMPLGDAAAALERGDIDAMLQVAAADAPVVARLMRSPRVKLMSLAQADALVRRIPAIAKVVLPAGVVDLAASVPAQDVVTVSSMATLVAPEDVHPAIAYLLVRAAQELHSGPGLLNPGREFPSIKIAQEYEVPEDVERLYASGPPFLYRHLPFWLANLLTRLWVLVIPIGAVLVSATDWLPRLLGWRGMQRINAIYRDAMRLEADARRLAGGGLDADQRADLDRRLAALRARVDDARLPRSLIKAKYEARGHLDLVAGTIAGLGGTALVAVRRDEV
jgi:TRAP transporter TAXI family solute receptor